MSKLIILAQIFISLFRIVGAQSDDELGSLDGEVADFPGEWISGIPLPCSEGCLIPANTYYVCFLNTTLLNGGQADQSQCDDYLCEDESYDHLRACLECIVANGNERPWGYHTNTALTAPVTDEPFSPSGPPVGGYIDQTQGEGWLANVTDRCSSIGRALEGVTTILTATPTATGPYQTAWTSGQTIRFTTWTGLTEYSELFYPSVTPVWGSELVSSDSSSSSTRRTSSAGSSTRTATSTARSDAASSTASAPAEATSSPNAGSAAQPVALPTYCLIFLGFLLV